jgi:hypothetical protein
VELLVFGLQTAYKKEYKGNASLLFNCRHHIITLDQVKDQQAQLSGILMAKEMNSIKYQLSFS